MHSRKQISFSCTCVLTCVNRRLGQCSVDILHSYPRLKSNLGNIGVHLFPKDFFLDDWLVNFNNASIIECDCFTVPSVDLRSFATLDFIDVHGVFIWSAIQACCMSAVFLCNTSVIDHLSFCFVTIVLQLHDVKLISFANLCTTAFAAYTSKS